MKTVEELVEVGYVRHYNNCAYQGKKYEVSDLIKECTCGLVAAMFNRLFEEKKKEVCDQYEEALVANNQIFTTRNILSLTKRG